MTAGLEAGATAGLETHTTAGLEARMTAGLETGATAWDYRQRPYCSRVPCSGSSLPASSSGGMKTADLRCPVLERQFESQLHKARIVDC